MSIGRMLLNKWLGKVEWSSIVKNDENWLLKVSALPAASFMMLSPTFMGAILDFLSLLMYVGPKAFIIGETIVNYVHILMQ